MDKRAGLANVCILRVEAEPDRLLITMTIVRPRQEGRASSSEPKVLHFSQPEAAIAAVADFIRSHGPPG